jgi:putative ubiquitin-RnfH superfamily antitoxin RatB of RatAB toxin-antitoxin module
MARIAVSVVWATPTLQDIVAVDVPAGATTRLAIERSGLVVAYGLDLAALGVAIHGKRATLETPLTDGDRVELTRPLVADPKEARRKRARR